MIILDGEKTKTLTSKYYNYIFFKEDVFDKDNNLVAPAGFFARWGETKDDDPDFSPYGPEILDLEISTGDCIGCEFCYKSNGSGQPTKHMSLETFKELLSRIPRTLTQIAFGITNIYANPDFFSIMEHARLSGIVPNYTTNGTDLDENAVKLTAELCGAVAVSVVNKQKTYDAVKAYTDAGMKQVNLHFMTSEETFDKALSVIDDMTTDRRLENMNAIVFLQYKPKGNGIGHFHPISSIEKYKYLVKYCQDKGVNFGFDSCSAPLFFKSIEDEPDPKKKEQYIQVSEPCEAFGMFSSYINVDGLYFPCSFCEGEGEWKEGIDVLHCNDFLKDVWFSAKVSKWRETILLSSKNCDCEFNNVCRSCPVFNITTCKKLEHCVQK